MTPNKKPEEHPLSQQWAPLDPKVKRAVRQSLTEWLAKEYTPPTEMSAELRALLKRMEEGETE